MLARTRPSSSSPSSLHLGVRFLPALLFGATIPVLLGPPAARGQSAEEVLQEALDRWEAQVEDVENYTLVQEVMGMETVTYYEKEMVDGHPTFVAVSTHRQGGAAGGMAGRPGVAGSPGDAPGAAGEQPARHAPARTPGAQAAPGAAGQADGGLDLDDLRNVLVQSAAEAGMEALVNEITGASKNQVAGLLGALGQQVRQAEGGGGGLAGGLAGALGQAAGLPGGGDLGGAAGEMLGALGGPGGFQQALLRAAGEAGMEGLAGAITGASGNQLVQLLGGLQNAGGLGSIQQLGALAAQHGVGALLGGELPDLGGLAGGAAGALAQAAGGNLAGAAAGALGEGAGLPGMGQGLPGMGGISGSVGQQFLTGAVTGGMGMLAGMGMQALAGAAAEGAAAGGTPGMTMDPAKMFRLLADHATLEGEETFDGHGVFVLVVKDPAALGESTDLELGAAEAFEPRDLTFYVDRGAYVLRGMRMEGKGSVGGDERDLTMTARLRDYREVEGLSHPFRVAATVEGLGQQLSDEERAEMEEAMEQFRQMQEQLKEMPPQQRAMVEQMMKDRFPQMEQMMESVAGDGPFEIELMVKELHVNEGPPGESGS